MEIQKLLATAIEHKNPPLVVNPLTVAKNAANKKRLVLDLRAINPLLSISRYKYEDISVATEHLENNCFLCVFDLKFGFHHMDIELEDQKFFLLLLRWMVLHLSGITVWFIGSGFSVLESIKGIDK